MRCAQIDPVMYAILLSKWKADLLAQVTADKGSIGDAGGTVDTLASPPRRSGVRRL